MLSPRTDVEAVRRAWPDVVARLASLRRVTWMLVRDHATVASFDGRRLVLSLDRPGALANFRSGAHSENVQHALIDVLGLETVVEATGGGLDEPAPDEPAGDAAAAQQDPGASVRADAAASWAGPAEPDTPQPTDDESEPQPRPYRQEPDGRQPNTGHDGRAPSRAVAPEPTMPHVPLVDAAHDEASRDDVDAADSGLVGRSVVEQLLGGRVIDETDA
jgi:DNA polymerase-3 subunit gamma/tau